MAKLQYQRKPIENDVERNIVLGCIVSTSYLDQTRPLLQNLHLIKDVYCRRIVNWCLTHYDKYKQAPKNVIKDIFASESKTIYREEEVGIIGSILDSINQSYIDQDEVFPDKYYKTQTEKYITEQSLLELASTIQSSVSQGNSDEALKALAGYNKVTKVVSTGIDPFNDPEWVHSIFARMKTSIIQFPHKALQELFKDVYRGDVLSIAGPAKRGKSFLMAQMGYYALYSGLNVAIFSYEMESEVLGARFFQNFLGQPRRKPDEPVRIPYFDGTDGNKIKYNNYEKAGLELESVLDYQKDFSTYNGLSIGQIRLFDHTQCGRRISDIVMTLHNLEKYEGLKIDVVVIDYDKLLENEDSFRGSEYEGINIIWKDTKAKIAQDLDTLVVLGSQYNKQGAKGEVGPEEASGSSRKFDYVSHWVSILQTEAEKRIGSMRLSVLGRHDKFIGSDKLVCLQALDLARPIIDAKWEHELPEYEEMLSQHSGDGWREETSEKVKEEKPVEVIDGREERRDSWNKGGVL